MIIAKSMPFELNFINYLNLFYLFRGVQIAKKKPEGQLLMQQGGCIVLTRFFWLTG